MRLSPRCSNPNLTAIAVPHPGTHTRPTPDERVPLTLPHDDGDYEDHPPTIRTQPSPRECRRNATPCGAVAFRLIISACLDGPTPPPCPRVPRRLPRPAMPRHPPTPPTATLLTATVHYCRDLLGPRSRVERLGGTCVVYYVSGFRSTSALGACWTRCQVVGPDLLPLFALSVEPMPLVLELLSIMLSHKIRSNVSRLASQYSRHTPQRFATTPGSQTDKGLRRQVTSDASGVQSSQ